jgi:hypothetical protein
VAIKKPAGVEDLLIDKRALQRKVAEVDARLGIAIDPRATAEQAQAMIRALGVRPEDREFTRELLRMRYGDEEP